MVILQFYYHCSLPPPISKKYDFIVIPHESHYEQYKINTQFKIVSTLTNDWELFINEIRASRLVISSSLHGIIIAEAYGVPAIFLDETENSDQLKYDDYYYSTGRMNYKRGKTVEECLSLQPEPLPDFSDMQKKILDAFPKDIFNV